MAEMYTSIFFILKLLKCENELTIRFTTSIRL